MTGLVPPVMGFLQQDKSPGMMGMSMGMGKGMEKPLGEAGGSGGRFFPMISEVKDDGGEGD